MLTRRHVLAATLASLCSPKTFAQTMCANGRGRYEGAVVAELLRDGRAIRLRQPFTYVDACGKPWIAPTGTISDGASIPAFLWKIVGTPLVGQYRDAAIIHDWFCAVRTEPYPAVHRMFYEAMLTSGVAAGTASRFYLGVRIGGPTWDALTTANARLAERVAAERAVERRNCTAFGEAVTCNVDLTSNLTRSPLTPLPPEWDIIVADQESAQRLSALSASLPLDSERPPSIDELDQAATRFLSSKP